MGEPYYDRSEPDYDVRLVNQIMMLGVNQMKLWDGVFV